MADGFFFSAGEDEQLAATNADFWQSLISHIREDRDESPRSVLDVGCHYGGLLSRLVDTWKPERAWGLEPLAPARRRAFAKVSGLAKDVRILDVGEWSDVPDAMFELITCHEMLYLEADLLGFMANIRRALSSPGRAYIVLGCHAENPVWAQWKPHVEALGHKVYDHRPMDILAAGATVGLLPSLRPLRQSGWITHDPRYGKFTFASAGDMIDHHFKHKLLFRFLRA